MESSSHPGELTAARDVRVDAIVRILTSGDEPLIASAASLIQLALLEAADRDFALAAEAVCAAFNRPLPEFCVSHLGELIFYAARVPGFRRAAACYRVIPALIRKLRDHTETPHIARRLCDALSNLAVDKLCQDEIALADGLPTLVSMLETHHTDALVAEAACCALLNAADHAPSQTSLGSSGSIPILAATLAMHAAVVPVASAACGALLNLADCAENLPRMARAGVIALLVEALALHPRETLLVSAACGTLQSLVEPGGQRLAILQAGALRIAAAGVTANLDAPEPPADAAVAGALAPLCELLSCISDFGPGCGAPPGNDALPVVLRVVRERPPSCAALKPAWETLWHVARDDDNASLLFQAGVIGLAVAAVPRPHLALAALSTLSNVPLDAATRIALAASGAVPVIGQAMRDLVADAGTMASALSTLWDWASCSNPQRDAMIAAGVPVAAVAACREHATDEDVVLHFCGWAQSFTSGYVPAKTALVNAGALPLLVGALESFPAHSVIAELVCVSLCLLASEAALIPAIYHTGAIVSARSARSRFGAWASGQARAPQHASGSAAALLSGTGSDATRDAAATDAARRVIDALELYEHDSIHGTGTNGRDGSAALD